MTGAGRAAAGGGELGPEAGELQTSCQNFFFFSPSAAAAAAFAAAFALNVGN